MRIDSRPRKGFTALNAWPAGESLRKCTGSDNHTDREKYVGGEKRKTSSFFGKRVRRCLRFAEI